MPDLCGTDPNCTFDLASVPAGASLGTATHSPWPHVWTSAMLDFLKSHPLDAR